MQDINYYKLLGNVSGILIDVNMNDKIKSHRYYFLDDSLNYYRINYVDRLIEYLDRENVNIRKMNNEEIISLYNKLLNKATEDLKETKKNYPGLADMTLYDNSIIDKKIYKRILKYYNEISKNIKSKDED